ncbi:unnamed protein product, partial [Polarella glacialis]
NHAKYKETRGNPQETLRKPEETPNLKKETPRKPTDPCGETHVSRFGAYNQWGAERRSKVVSRLTIRLCRFEVLYNNVFSKRTGYGCVRKCLFPERYAK